VCSWFNIVTCMQVVCKLQAITWLLHTHADLHAVLRDMHCQTFGRISGYCIKLPADATIITAKRPRKTTLPGPRQCVNTWRTIAACRPA
jgi:hypothetical protein